MSEFRVVSNGKYVSSHATFEEAYRAVLALNRVAGKIVAHVDSDELLHGGLVIERKQQQSKPKLSKARALSESEKQELEQAASKKSTKDGDKDAYAKATEKMIAEMRKEQARARIQREREAQRKRGMQRIAQMMKERNKETKEAKKEPKQQEPRRDGLKLNFDL